MKQKIKHFMNVDNSVLIKCMYRKFSPISAYFNKKREVVYSFPKSWSHMMCLPVPQKSQKDPVSLEELCNITPLVGLGSTRLVGILVIK